MLAKSDITSANVAWWLGRAMPRSARRSYQVSNEAPLGRMQTKLRHRETSALRFYRHWNPIDKPP
jgi:hypothetical protein